MGNFMVFRKENIHVFDVRLFFEINGTAFVGKIKTLITLF